MVIYSQRAASSGDHHVKTPLDLSLSFTPARLEYEMSDPELRAKSEHPPIVESSPSIQLMTDADSSRSWFRAVQADL